MRATKINDITVSFNKRTNTATITTHYDDGRVCAKYRVYDANEDGSDYYPDYATYRDWMSLLRNSGAVAVR